LDVFELSTTAKLLFKLGLRRYPDLLLLLDIVKGPNPDIRKAALRYLFDKWALYKEAYEDDQNQKIIAGLEFVPVDNPSSISRLAKVLEASGYNRLCEEWKALMCCGVQVYADERCRIMGFSIIQEEYRQHAVKLNISAHPPCSTILKERPPTNQCTAELYFEYFFSMTPSCSRPYPEHHSEGTHQSELTNEELSDLGSLCFVPISDVCLVTPQECYVGKPRHKLHSKLFHFVDFGPCGNLFLKACGAKDEPAVDDIASALVHELMFYEIAGSPDEYLHPIILPLHMLTNSSAGICGNCRMLQIGVQRF
jgi:hypothetical protein